MGELFKKIKRLWRTLKWLYQIEDIKEELIHRNIQDQIDKAITENDTDNHCHYENIFCNKNEMEEIIEEINTVLDSLLASDKVNRKDIDKLLNDNNGKTISEKILSYEGMKDYIENNIRYNISLDKHTFEKRLQLAQLRRHTDYDSVMKTIKKILTGVADNYLITKYIKVDGMGGYKPIQLTAENMIQDMGNIYDNLLSVINVSVIDEDLALFYDPSKMHTKNHFISQIIEPVYRVKINAIVEQYNKYMEEKVFVPSSLYEKSRIEEIELEVTEKEKQLMDKIDKVMGQRKKIDEILTSK